MFLDLAAVLVGAGGFIWASRRRITEQRRAVAVPDARRLASIPGVGGNPQSIALSPDGRTAYLPTHERGTLAVVDLDNRAVRALLQVGKDATDALALPDGRRVLVSLVRGRGGGLVVVDALEGRVTGTVARHGDPRCYLTDPWGGTLLVLSGHRGDVLETIPFGTNAPIDVTAGPDGVMYVACQTGSLDVIRP